MKLYKYMSGNIATIFLTTPLLRLGNPNGLNDPFEFALTETLSKDISNMLEKSGTRQDGLRTYIDNFKSFGIISISETYDNLLMWSHYADEHRGAVFEFEIDESDPYQLFTCDKPENTSDNIFGKVNYRKTREYQGELLNSDISSIRKHYIFTKSDEWIYEKEHRYVMHYSNADIVKVNLEECKNAFNAINYNFQDFINGDGVETDEDGVNLWINLHVSNLHADILEMMWIMTLHMNSFFFKIVNFKHVTKFIMGCRYNHDIDSVIKSLKNTQAKERFFDKNEFQNIVKAKPHRERFELDFKNYEGKFFSYFS